MAVQVYSHAMKTEHTIVETVLLGLLSLCKIVLSEVFLFVKCGFGVDDASLSNGEAFDEKKHFSEENAAMDHYTYYSSD